MLGYGKDKGMNAICKAMEVGVARRQGAKGNMLMAGADVVTWSMVADSEASASPHLTQAFSMIREYAREMALETINEARLSVKSEACCQATSRRASIQHIWRAKVAMSVVPRSRQSH